MEFFETTLTLETDMKAMNDKSFAWAQNLLIAGAASLALLQAPKASAHSGMHDGMAGEETAFGEAGDPKKPSRIVQVVMREADGKMEFVPNRIDVRKGEQIRFVLRNNGETDHEFVLATREANLKHAEEMRKNPDMEHDDPNARRLAPKQTGEILWHFIKAGDFDFSCLIPGHLEAGMTGSVIVK